MKGIKNFFVTALKFVVWGIIFPIRLIKIFPSELRAGNFKYAAGIILLLTGFNAWLRTRDVELAELVRVFGSLKFAAGLYLLSGKDSAEVSPLFKFNITWKSFWREIGDFLTFDWFKN